MYEFERDFSHSMPKDCLRAAESSRRVQSLVEKSMPSLSQLTFAPVDTKNGGRYCGYSLLFIFFKSLV